MFNKSKRTVLAVIAGLCSVATGFAADASRLQLSGHVPAVVSHLAPQSRLPSTNLLTLAICLPLSDPAGLDDFLRQLYDPHSTNFHRFLTPSQNAERFGPPAGDYLAVRQFAESNGLAVFATYSNRMVLNVKGQVSDIERAFQIHLNQYQHPAEPRTFFAPDSEPSVPATLKVLSVEGLTDFSRPRHSGRKQTVLPGHPLSFNGTGPNSEYAGNDFRNAYVPGTQLNGAGQTVALLEYSDYFKVDITNYENYVGKTIGVTNYVPLTNVVIFGGTPSTSANDEVALDIEMAIAMAPKLSRVIVYEESSANSSVLSQIQSDNLAHQVSSSWTVGNWTSSTATTWDNILKLMAAQGQSYFQSSGDSDAYTGTQTLDSGVTVPADSPYATIVGGTTLTMTGSGVAYNGETVWNYNNNGIPNEGSGGGVSIFYPIPTWQAAPGITNNVSPSFRNTPDVSLTADDIYVCYNNGDTGGSSYFMGTSAAAPLWAGFTALVNQQAQVGGLSPVGFVNPALYAFATNANYTTLFHDITSGTNIGTNAPNLYAATNGYDLCTGLGTPNGTNLINALAPVSFAAVITNAGSALLTESATPANGQIDPGETVTINFTLQNLGNLATSSLMAALLPNTNVLAPGAPQNYGAIAAFGGTASRSFTFTAAGSCGSNFTATLQLQDGVNNLGLVNFNLLLGQPATFSQNFDSVSAPALPSGWSSVNISGTASSWTTTTSSSDTAPNSAFVTDVGSTSENALVSPVIPIGSANAQLTFRHNFAFEYHAGNTRNRDGGILQIQIGSGGFTDIVSAGGSFVAGGYNGTISTTANPLGTVSAWVESSGGWQTVTVNLPAAAAGQNIQLRWVEGTDSSNSGGTPVGWNVDSVSISGVQPNCLSVFTDLAISQTLAANSYQPGQNLIYTLSVTNLGPQAAANVVVTDTVPVNTTFVSAPGGSFASGQVIFSAPMLAANATTNFSLTLAPVSGTLFTNVATVVTVTQQIGATNTSTTLVSAQLTNAPPSIITPLVTQTIQCGSNVSYSVGVSGTAPFFYQWSLDSVPISAATNTSLVLTNVHTPSHTVAVVVTNAFGSVTSSVPLVVQDTLPPVISIRGSNPIFMQFGAAYFELGATAADVCAGSVAVGISGVVNTNAVSTNTITYSANDGNGNIATSNRIVYVVDTRAPTILWSFTNLVLAANSNCAAVMPNVTGTNFIQSTDLSGISSVTQTPTNNASLPLGTNVVVIAVADPYGNTAYSTNQIIVRDQTPPVITLNGFSQLTNQLGMAFVDPGATAGDACSGIASFATNGVVNVNIVGTNLLAYVAVDGSGNTNITTRTVFVVDTAPPTIVWSFTNLVLAANSNCVAIMPDVTGTNFIQDADLSGVAMISQIPTNNFALPLGTNLVVIAVSDVYSNTAYSTNSIVVQDQTPPQIVLQPLSQTNNAGGVATFNVAATACTPLQFSWSFNSAPLSLQTNSVLVLSNLNFSMAGNYAVVVSANGGSVTSSVATLTVYAPPGIGSVTVNTNGTFGLSLTGTPGDTYVVEAATNLQFPTSWLFLATNTLGSNGVWQFTDLQATNFSQQFYRLMLAP